VWSLLVASVVLLVAYDCCWLLLVAAGCCWLLLVAAGCFWLLLVAAGCFWLLLVVGVPLVASVVAAVVEVLSA